MILRQGALSFAPRGTVLTGPSLIHGALARVAAADPDSLTPIATCNVLAVMLAGTPSMTAAAEVIETACGCAFVVGSGAEPSVACSAHARCSQRLRCCSERAEERLGGDLRSL